MDYATLVDDKRLDAFIRLIDVIDANLPDGFEKTTDGSGIHYVVPLSTYPSGYHVTPGTPPSVFKCHRPKAASRRLSYGRLHGRSIA
ncbi:hypothetical protein [Exiguobacterium sp. AB2]|uniref:hypothetical protein n=1 Tax=Exiguobacterium sp. AB2 TaxID=1484479 RepID=UPI000A92D5B0